MSLTVWRPLRRTLPLAAVFLIAALLANAALAAAPYFPPRGPDWQRRQPADVGIDAVKMQQAIDYAIANETKFPEDLAAVGDVRDLAFKLRMDWSFEPYGGLLGPTKRRAPLNGLIIRHGYIVAEWGQTQRVDMTFSVTKTFLSSVAGVAFDRGMIRDINDKAGDYVKNGLFDSPHNAKITWNHLLRQTSEWQGELWGIPDWADRPKRDKAWSEMLPPRPQPGERWKYNDVRVNVLALALLNVWREPLPHVLKREVMDPIGASDSWRWNGYDNSWVNIDGIDMQSVSGGGHWGGGMFITARDLARLGLLGLNRGTWAGRRILSEKWVSMALTPTAPHPTYGFMNWFLNTDGKLLADAPRNSFYYAGSGANIVYVDPDDDLVVVVRWIDRRHINDFIKRVLAAVK